MNLCLIAGIQDMGLRYDVLRPLGDAGFEYDR